MKSNQMLGEAICLLTEFRRQRDSGSLDPEAASHWAMRAAEIIITCHERSGQYLRDAVTLLCEITSNENQQIVQAGATALFPALVERLNDSFEPAACLLYDRILAQVIDFYRRLPAAEALDKTLRDFGLTSEADLLDRKSQISTHQSQLSNPRKVLFLSRVTIGADVAVTSVMIAKLRDLLPEAEFVLLGSRKLRDLFGGAARIRIHELTYGRGATVLSRLLSWLDVVEAVKSELHGLKPEEFLILDPDSRLTQLGLLPLVENDARYLFFESRSFRREGASHLGQLASQWMNESFGLRGEAFPFVALPHEHQRLGQTIAHSLRRAGCSPLVAISLGVGGNERKRISDEFERKLVEHLLIKSTLILDKGATNDERERIDRITSPLRRQGKIILDVNEENASEVMGQDSISAHIITWDGGIGAFAGLIAASDRYIGYDSAGQHIAAALKVPTLTVFVNSASPVFAERWRPYGSGIRRVVNFDVEHLTTKPVVFIPGIEAFLAGLDTEGYNHELLKR